MPGSWTFWASVAAAFLLPLASSSEQPPPHNNRPGDEAFKCDVHREERATITFKAMELLQRERFELVKTGIFAGHVRIVEGGWMGDGWMVI